MAAKSFYDMLLGKKKPETARTGTVNRSSRKQLDALETGKYPGRKKATTKKKPTRAINQRIR